MVRKQEFQIVKVNFPVRISYTSGSQIGVYGAQPEVVISFVVTEVQKKKNHKPLPKLLYSLLSSHSDLIGF